MYGKVMNIPKIFCISMKSTSQRGELAEAYFKEIGFDVEFFYGIDGRQLNLEELRVYDKCGWRVRNGVVGTTLSHRLLWVVLLTMPYEEILIVEDDVLFVEDVREKFMEYSREVPDDWGMLYWGGGFYPQHSGEKKRISEHVLKFKPTGTYAYMVKRSILPKCLAYTDNSLIDIDVNMSQGLHEAINVYAFDPPLAKDRSVNGGEYVKEGPWKSLTYNWEGIQ